ncbi:serine/threonine-protein kinase [Zavarzinella formosa]|uniref:serine/threonine-protein kinase n=1 Tax=Zavarzinella formosa TaxID=360055 RepID=UPI0002DA5ED6|nr:serine/threonine-protein kinase [Zavarzinella formosa]
MNERDIFWEALNKTNKAERAAYLGEACGPDNTLRQRIEQLLTMHESADSLLNRRPAEMLAELNDRTRPVEEDTETFSARTGEAQLAAFLAPATRPDAIGRLGHYEVLRVLGQGGFGIVVKAFDETLHRMVAIKVLAPHLSVTSPPRKRFLREARVAARVRHENVVQIYAVEEQPLPYLVMEFVEGQTLQQYLDANGPIPAEDVIRLGQQIALGLAAAHEQGLIHRDVKPANILLKTGVDVHVKLTDFGLARASDDANMTQSGVVAGTPMYMAPEQALGERLDQRADLFSFGSVLYAMTSGRPPFRAPSALAILKRVADDTPRPVREIIADVPEGLSGVIAKLHEKNPDHRFSSAIETAEALSRCLTDPLPAKPASKSRWKKAAVVAAGLFLLVAAGWLAFPPAKPVNGRDGVRQIAETPPNYPPSVSKEIETPKPAPVVSKEDAWKATVALLPAKEQFEAVVAKLKELNPDWNDKSAWHRIDDNIVALLGINEAKNLNNLSPLHGFTALKELRLYGDETGVTDLSSLRGLKLVSIESHNNAFKDVSPLADMPLWHLSIWSSACKDLSPLRGMKITHLNCGGNEVLKDLSPLKGMPLKFLCLNLSEIEDLSPLEGMPLKELMCRNTKVTNLAPLAKSPIEKLLIDGSPIADYSPLKSLPLKHINLTYMPETHAALLRSIPTLETINDKPAAEFLGVPP